MGVTSRKPCARRQAWTPRGAPGCRSTGFGWMIIPRLLDGGLHRNTERALLRHREEAAVQHQEPMPAAQRHQRDGHVDRPIRVRKADVVEPVLRVEELGPRRSAPVLRMAPFRRSARSGGRSGASRNRCRSPSRTSARARRCRSSGFRRRTLFRRRRPSSSTAAIAS
jgi:hypothetical protein